MSFWSCKILSLCVTVKTPVQHLHLGRHKIHTSTLAFLGRISLCCHYLKKHSPPPVPTYTHTVPFRLQLVSLVVPQTVGLTVNCWYDGTQQREMHHHNDYKS